jgi:hypothetical protein
MIENMDKYSQRARERLQKLYSPEESENLVQTSKNDTVTS